MLNKKESNMGKYRKKPVVVEANQLTINNISFLESWCGGSIKGIKLPIEERVIDIQTLEGEMRANMGDYIVKGIKGEFYPCKPDIFEDSYEAVAEPCHCGGSDVCRICAKY
jgi:hypothetical protein